MTDPRDQALLTLRKLLDGRPVRWAALPLGDYDGRERTLEIFNADAGEQRDLLRRLRGFRADLDTAAGGPVVFVFHTRAESARLYADFVEQALRVQVATDVDAVEVTSVADSPPLTTDVGVHVGDRSLPRRPAA